MKIEPNEISSIHYVEQIRYRLEKILNLATCQWLAKHFAPEEQSEWLIYHHSKSISRKIEETYSFMEIQSLNFNSKSTANLLLAALIKVQIQGDALVSYLYGEYLATVEDTDAKRAIDLEWFKNRPSALSLIVEACDTDFPILTNLIRSSTVCDASLALNAIRTIGMDEVLATCEPNQVKRKVLNENFQ